jgi:hypothetical protein
MKIKMEIINIGGIWNAIINNSIPQRYSELRDKTKCDDKFKIFNKINPFQNEK